MKLISFICLLAGIYCGWYNYERGHNLVLIPAGIAVFVGLFCAVKVVKQKNGDVLAWFLTVANGLLAIIAVLIGFSVVISAVL